MTADLNTPITDNVAFRLNFMNLDAKSSVPGVDLETRTGVAPTLSIGAGTDDEWNLSYYYLNTDNTLDLVPYFQNAPLNVPIERFYGMAMGLRAKQDRNCHGQLSKMFSKWRNLKPPCVMRKYDRSLREPRRVWRRVRGDLR